MTRLRCTLQVQVFFQRALHQDNAIIAKADHNSHGLSPLPKSTCPTFTRPSIAQLLPDRLEHFSNLSFLFLSLSDVFLSLSWLGSGSSVEVEDEFLGQLGD